MKSHPVANQPGACGGRWLLMARRLVGGNGGGGGFLWGDWGGRG